MSILDPRIEIWAVENGVDMGVLQQAVSSRDLPVWHDWRGRARINPAVGHAWLSGYRAGDRQGYRRGLQQISRRDHAIGFGKGHDEGHAYGREEGIRIGHAAGYREGQAGSLTIKITNHEPVRLVILPFRQH